MCPGSGACIFMGPFRRSAALTSIPTSSIALASRSLPTISDSVVLQEMENGAVLYCVESEIYFGLNAVGLRIWSFMEQTGGTLEELVLHIQSEFPGVPPDAIRNDVLEFLDELDTATLTQSQASDPDQP